MTTPNTDPSNRPPSLYEMTNQPERKGSGGLIVLALLILLLAGGAYYYFGVMRKQPVAAASLPAAATPAPAAPPKPTPYNSVTEQKYIDEADHAFLAIQQPKVQAFNDAFAAFKTAGYVSAKGLSTKESVAARRDLIAKCLATNDDYAAFVGTQLDTFHDLLTKTPLTPLDVKSTFDNSPLKARTPDIIKLRQSEHDYLKTCDDMMAALEKWSGEWSTNPEGKLQLKRKENIAEYNQLAQKCNAAYMVVSQTQKDYNAAWGGTAETAVSGTGTASSTPAATPAMSAPPVAAPSATP